MIPKHLQLVSYVYTRYHKGVSTFQRIYQLSISMLLHFSSFGNKCISNFITLGAGQNIQIRRPLSIAGFTDEKKCTINFWVCFLLQQKTLNQSGKLKDA